jgi:hypothetical protein
VNRTTIVFAASLALTAALPVSSAQAMSARTFVSGHGNDGNSCLYAAPCRTFAGAYAKTAAGGEITVLDPAGYGPLTITTSLSIVNDGVGEAGMIFTADGNGVTINAGASDVVTLRGLTLNGGGFSGGSGTKGIIFNSGASLTVENCVIRRFTYGIFFIPGADSNLSVSNTVASNNVGDGITVNPSGSGAVTAVFNRVETNNNAIGIDISGGGSSGTLKATVSHSVAAKNTGQGYVASSNGAAPTTLMILNSVTANNNIGLQVNVGATLRIFDSIVTGNTIGWFNDGGVLQSYGNNSIDGNQSAEAAPPSVAQK